MRSDIEDLMKNFYDDETKKQLIKTYGFQIAGFVHAAMDLLQDRSSGGKITKEQMIDLMLACMSGVFMVGFYYGNNLFLDDEKKEAKK